MLLCIDFGLLLIKNNFVHVCLFFLTDRELVVELERMRLEGGIALGDKSPSRLDAFVKTIEEDRDYYKRELECLRKILRRRSSPLRRSPQKVMFAKIKFL